jgi:hypothetical protein
MKIDVPDGDEGRARLRSKPSLLPKVKEKGRYD